LKQIETTLGHADQNFLVLGCMDKQKHNKFVYDADGVDFTIYKTVKSTKAGPTTYWLLEDYSTGKRRLLPSEKICKLVKPMPSVLIAKIVPLPKEQGGYIPPAEAVPYSVFPDRINQHEG